MSWTKRQLVEMSLEEIGLASYVFDLQPQQLQSALRRMDAMVANWTADGLHVGYPLPGSPENADLDAETNIPDSAAMTIICNLAMQIAPSYGKEVNTSTRLHAKQGMDALLSKANVPNKKQYIDTLPLGQGNKPHRGTGQQYIIQDPEPLTSSDDDQIILE